MSPSIYWEQGYQANRAGKLRKDNPHASFMQHREWDDGWLAAEPKDEESEDDSPSVQGAGILEAALVGAIPEGEASPIPADAGSPDPAPAPEPEAFESGGGDGGGGGASASFDSPSQDTSSAGGDSGSSGSDSGSSSGGDS